MDRKLVEGVSTILSEFGGGTVLWRPKYKSRITVQFGEEKR
jgi:hypothetical protein